MNNALKLVLERGEKFQTLNKNCQLFQKTINFAAYEL